MHSNLREIPVILTELKFQKNDNWILNEWELINSRFLWWKKDDLYEKSNSNKEWNHADVHR